MRNWWISKIIFVAVFLLHPKQAYSLNTVLQEWPATMIKDVILQHYQPSLQSFKKKNNSLGCYSLKDIIMILTLMANKYHPDARKYIEENPYSIKGNKENYSIFILLKDYIKRIDVSPLKTSHPYKKGGYYSYYDSKKENFSILDQKYWKTKQKNVYHLLSKYRPKQVLDIGANKGWFSLLAESLGANVIAADIDEFCMDELYKKSQGEHLKITPLIMSFEKLSKPQVSHRLKSELVLCLALVHHLVLVGGLSIDAIFKTLSDITEKVLILEYVDLEDPRIKRAIDDENYKSHAVVYRTVASNLNVYAKKHYNLSNFIRTGKKYFRDVYVLDSHPLTRKLLVFTKE